MTSSAVCSPFCVCKQSGSSHGLPHASLARCRFRTTQTIQRNARAHSTAILSQSTTGLTRQRTHVQWVRLAFCLNKLSLAKVCLSLENRQEACLYRLSGHDGWILSRNEYLWWHHQSVSLRRTRRRRLLLELFVGDGCCESSFVLRVRWAGHEEARTASVSVVFAPGFCLCIGVNRWCICIASQWVET